MVGFNKPLVSIVIVTYNSDRYIKNCLETIKKTTYQKLETIVVDNASIDKTLEIIRFNFPKVKLVKNKVNTGYAAGCNQGVAEAQGSYVVIINPDTTVTANWLQPLLENINHKQVAVCQPLIMLSQKPEIVNLSGKTVHYLGFDWLSDYKSKKIHFKVKNIDSFSGSAFLINKKIFKKAGGFDSRYFMYYEDGDLSWRLRLMGYRLLMVPESIVYHDYKYIPDEDYQSTRKKFYLLERNRLITLLKNYSLKSLILISPALFVAELGMIGYFVMKGWVLEKFKGYLWVILNIHKIYNARIISQKLRTIDDKNVSLNFASKIEFKEVKSNLLKYFLNPVFAGYWNIIKKII